MIIFYSCIRLVPVSLIFFVSSIFTPNVSTNDSRCHLVQRVVQELAARWPGHPYQWPRLAECQNIASIGLGGEGSAVGKWVALPWGGVFRVSKRWLPKNNSCSEEVIVSSVTWGICWFLISGVPQESSSFSIFFATEANSKVAGAVQLSGESAGLWWDLKVTPTWLKACVKRTPPRLCDASSDHQWTELGMNEMMWLMIKLLAAIWLWGLNRKTSVWLAQLNMCRAGLNCRKTFACVEHFCIILLSSIFDLA